MSELEQPRDLVDAQHELIAALLEEKRELERKIRELQDDRTFPGQAFV